MRTHSRITRLLTTASDHQRCAIAQNHADQMALLRRVHCKQVVSPYRGVFADAEYWALLNLTQKTMHIARALMILHPSWVFAGPTSAAFHGFEHQWSIHRAGVYIADTANKSGKLHSTNLNRMYMATIPVCVIGGVRVTSIARTLVDCGMLLPFCQALAIFDSAFALTGVTADEVRAACAAMHGDCAAIELLLTYVDPRSENGGESMLRGVTIEEGFVPPDLQRVFVNPRNGAERCRVDFSWTLPDGRIVVVEYDGMAKYVDPSMTGRRTIKAIVNQQNRREQILMAAGVSVIIRFDYDDLFNREKIVSLLTGAQVPRHFRLEQRRSRIVVTQTDGFA